MTLDQLLALNEDDALIYIRGMLHGDKFNMSGYNNDDTPGTCVAHNMHILLKFAHLGIFDAHDFLYLDFYKGTGTLFYGADRDLCSTEDAFGGLGTKDIILEILKLCKSGPNRRRVD